MRGRRYVRQYRTKLGSRWALWETDEHGRARRVGTAKTEAQYLAFLGLEERFTGADGLLHVVGVRELRAVT